MSRGPAVQRRRLAANDDNDWRMRDAGRRRSGEKLKRWSSGLGALNDERASIESVLAGGAIYREDERARLHELLVRRGKLDAEITTVETAWLERKRATRCNA